MDQKLASEIEIPEGTTVNIDRGLIRVKGKRGEVSKKLLYPGINIRQEQNKIVISSKRSTKREKKIISSFNAHIKNLIKGANEGYIYKLKICSGHFPMNVSVSEKEFSIKNFLGEKKPRKLKLPENVKVKIDGNEVIVEGNNKEETGQTAASIEHLTKVKNRDRRIFQDGIYITNKAGKEIK